MDNIQIYFLCIGILMIALVGVMVWNDCRRKEMSLTEFEKKAKDLLEKYSGNKGYICDVFINSKSENKAIFMYAKVYKYFKYEDIDISVKESRFRFDIALRKLKAELEKIYGKTEVTITQ